MFSVANVKPRYFEFQQPGGDNVLKIEPPKLKTLRELEEVGNDDRKLIEVVAKIIAKNTAGFRVTPEMVESWLDVDQLVEFITAFMDWLRAERKADPNEAPPITLKRARRGYISTFPQCANTQ